jgi:hypothetical protein
VQAWEKPVDNPDFSFAIRARHHPGQNMINVTRVDMDNSYRSIAPRISMARSYKTTIAGRADDMKTIIASTSRGGNEQAMPDTGEATSWPARDVHACRGQGRFAQTNS